MNAKDNKKKNDSIKKIIAAILILVVIALMSKKADAATLPMLPALPYVPPSRVQVWDLLNNMFGLTRLNISDEQKRLQAYEQMLGQYITQAEMDDIVQRAREARKMEIKAAIRDGVQEYMLYQIQTGYEQVDNEAITGTTTMNAADAQRIVDALANMNVQQTVAELQQRYAQAARAIGGNLSVCVWVTRYSNKYAIWQGFYKAQYTATWKGTVEYGYNVQGETYLFQSGSGIKYNNKYGDSGTYAGKLALYSTSVWDNHILHVNFGKVSEYKKATAQSSAITTALQTYDDIPLTASSQMVNGQLDKTRDIVSTLPATLPQAASDVQDLPAVQEQLGVLPAPISQDIEQSITQLQEQQAAQYGDTGEYAIDLTQLFPFCLPFDIYRILVAFEAEPETPQIHFELVNPWSNGENAEKWEAELDLSRFDGVAALVRKLELLLYCVGLAMITRSVFLRG